MMIRNRSAGFGSTTRTRRRIAVATAIATSVIGAPSLIAVGPTATASTVRCDATTCYYLPVGHEQTFVVPPGVTSIQVWARGADGGSALGASGGAGDELWG